MSAQSMADVEEPIGSLSEGSGPQLLAAHQAAALSAAGFGLVTDAKAEAFEQGQKSGLRYATRMAAAVRIGKPELAGPMSNNPYRAEAVSGRG